MRTRYIVKDLVQGSQEWLEFRRGKIGASIAPVIMGVSPFQTPLQLFEEIIFDKTRPKTKAMQRGNDLEEKARQWLNARPGLSGQYKPAVIQSVAHPEFIASLDGYYVNANGKPHLAEIKVPGIEAHLEAIEGRIPIYYQPQLQHQMDLAGVDQMLYVSFDGEDGVVIPCHRDEHYCVELFAAELAFLASIIDFKPPEPVDRDWVELNDPEATVMAFRYQEISELIDNLEMERDSIKKDLIERVNHSRSRVGRLRMQKILRKGNIKYNEIPELKEVDLEKYRGQKIESWRFTSSEDL